MKWWDAIALSIVLVCGPALADGPVATAAPEPQSVVVTATRIATPPFKVPASIDLIEGAQIRDDRLQVNLSESLGAVAGLQARERQNYAQDLQVSVRGFGARSTFGIRGVRLYVDGIPATLPDGQGQLSHVDLGSADRIEVLRGPFSALYGNSSGGVIQVFTEEGRGAPALTASLAAGSDGVSRLAFKAAGAVGADGADGATGALGWLLSGSRFETRGWREHSAALRRIGNAKLQWTATPDTRVGLVANSVALPRAQDPLGLSRAQFAANPRGADPSAAAFDTRKTVDQNQLGVVVDQRLDAAHALRLLVYGGQRDTEQFQAIPVATQSNALHPGGVIQLGRNYSGADLRWTLTAALGGRPFSFIAGLARDALAEHRIGRLNFIGNVLGVEGALRRDEDNRVHNTDGYLQLAWQPLPELGFNAGLRRSAVRFASTDHYIVGANPDDSGRVDYGATLPVIGVAYAPLEALRFYATAGRGFETPTLNELAYRADGLTGLNLGLRAARSNNLEVGIKTRLSGWGEGRLALFDTRTSREIVTLSNVGGRSTFTNAGSTRRTGWEASWDLALTEDLRLQAAYSGLAARYGDAFLSCTTTPCATPTTLIAAGNRLPGVSRQTAYAALAWLPAQGWRGGVEVRAASKVAVNDANTDAAAGNVVASVHLGHAATLGPCRLGAFVRIDNLFARRYAGSVIVNEGNARYFEPAPGRTWAAGVSATLQF
jgi:iron complex outermembrane receptor protein